MDVGSVVPGSIRQVGYVVRDLDAALGRWCVLGIGPWFTIRDMRQRGCRYRGEPCAPTLSIAFANSGPMQIELIQQVDDGPSIYREFLDAGGDGYHQLAWWAEDFDGMLARADAAGWPLVFSGDAGGAARFAYFELDPTISTIIEVTELNDVTRGLADLLEGATAAWDGTTEPVRSLF